MATFSCSFSSITDTTAKFTAEFEGGDSSYTRARYIDLVIEDVGSWRITSSNTGGSDSSFSKTISGLDPDTTYYWDATMLYIANGEYVETSYTDSGSFTTDPAAIDIALWSWSSSNGSASTSQTKSAYNVLMGTATIENFSHKVWNDLVDKVSEVHFADTGYEWDVASGKYLSKEDCKVSAGDTLSAEIYNAVRYNVGSVISTGITDVTANSTELTGYHIIRLAERLNDYINTM